MNLKLTDILEFLAAGHRHLWLKLPHFDKKEVLAEIISVDFEHSKRPVRVRFITELYKTEKELVETEGFARVAGETQLKDVTRPYETDIIDLAWITKLCETECDKRNINHNMALEGPYWACQNRGCEYRHR